MSMTGDKPEFCESCKFETTDLKVYENFPMSVEGKHTKNKWLCFLCANTMAGRYWESKEKNHELFEHVCLTANLLLKLIRDK
jgi:hypothetical protein